MPVEKSVLRKIAFLVCLNSFREIKIKGWEKVRIGITRRVQNTSSFIKHS